MTEISSQQSSPAQTAVVWLATLVALVLLGAVLAYWTWAWLAPQAQARAPAAAAQPQIGQAYNLFGRAQLQPAAAPGGVAIRLLGVVADAAQRRGYAVVQLDEKQILAVREGDDVVPGIRLVEVRADHVVLGRDGAREILAWPEKSSRARAAVAVPVTTAPGPTLPARTRD